MRKLDNFIRNLQNFDMIAKVAVADSIDNNLDNFEQMQRDRLNKGINAEGEPLERNVSAGRPYSPAYRRKRVTAGLQVQHVDLNFDGTYQSKMTAKRIGLNILHLGNTDEKHKFLSGQYDHILGFSPDQRVQVKFIMKDEISRRIKQQITNV